MSGVFVESILELLFSERVSIEVVNGENDITVTVTNNFTTNNLAFRVDINLTTLGTNEMATCPPLNGVQNQAQFNYRQPNRTVCDIFSFTVTPSEMEGISSEPVTGFFTTVTGTVNVSIKCILCLKFTTGNNNVTPLISQGENVLRKIVNLGGTVRDVLTVRNTYESPLRYPTVPTSPPTK